MTFLMLGILTMITSFILIGANNAFSFGILVVIGYATLFGYILTKDDDKKGR